MLTDALPRDGAGAVKSGAFGLLVERDGRIVAAPTTIIVRATR